jgi:hypothetical protein
MDNAARSRLVVPEEFESQAAQKEWSCPRSSGVLAVSRDQPRPDPLLLLLPAAANSIHRWDCSLQRAGALVLPTGVAACPPSMGTAVLTPANRCWDNSY